MALSVGIQEDTSEIVGMALESLRQLEDDINMPKNAKTRIHAITGILQQGEELSLRTHKALAECDEIANNPHLDQITRAQIWNIVSLLEKVNGR
ncbi:UPF0147 family protein [Candidatus Woesearchaeota archaeon]|nr:UPF0147 family protein [Candidatus Woesearchaeota archaeon]